MDSRKNSVAKQRRSASQDTTSTAAKPPRPAPPGKGRASRSPVETTSSAAAEDAGSGQTTSSMSTLSSGFQSFLEETNSEPCKSELTSYLEDKTHPIDDPNFTLLHWWRLNAHRYPIMAKMAKKFLTVPATSVSSESTFSTGGRVLDDYRSSLHPKMVEALVCASSFIKGSKENRVTPTIIVEDDTDEDVEFIPFPESSVESN